ncbi:GNAT family N-acetyltransferase [Pseudovibrio sp. SPO723]|uniref:GNAT family N-acetyltransferase n=1 Tax=Nesiotobacter zosterae TaxID=392721 RepID=UPI0029C2777C|nr:GNAT family N-acetyltransferase [Pseudovibrio sp. SPO723]MDX5594064.1 GNAT family N-acetyltransferase [Pseudovibrio sp. SPO723]
MFSKSEFAEIDLNWAHFDALSARDVYDALKLRCLVFIVEQECPYPDIDGEDLAAVHLLARRKSDGKLVAYLRVFEPTQVASYWKIGRVVVDPSARGSGLARQIMSSAMAYCKDHGAGNEIHLQAQVYLSAFYESFGFRPVSSEYLEDGIPHIDMKKSSLG